MKVLLQGCEFEGNGGSGISISGDCNVNIDNCHSDKNEFYGLNVISGIPKVSVKNFSAMNNGAGGVNITNFGDTNIGAPNTFAQGLLSSVAYGVTKAIIPQ